ncbi:MAG TPA: hypothetical protein VI197_08985 [Polyangiaceae bacterium]
MAERYIKTAEHSSFSGLKKAAKLGNVLRLAIVVASLLRFRRRACMVLACLASALCAASIASANPSVQAKTRVWDFAFAEPLNTCPIDAASARTHLENQSGSTELASASPHAARGTLYEGSIVLGAADDAFVAAAAKATPKKGISM